MKHKKRKRKRTEWKCRFEDIPPDCYEDVLVWDCSWNGLTSLPSEIGHLTSLQELDCEDNQLDSKTSEAVEKLLVRNKEGDPRDDPVLVLLHTFLGNTFSFQLCDQILLHCRVLWFYDDVGVQ